MRPAYLLLGLLFCNHAGGHTYHLGDCLDVEPMPNFDMSQFLGVWYVIEKTSTNSRCLYYNFTESGEPGQYLVEEVGERGLVGLHSVGGLSSVHRSTGTLEVPPKGSPAQMKAKFPWNPFGTASYIVFMTNYDSYAGIYSCQKIPLSNRRSSSILSRRNTLKKEELEKIRETLDGFGVDPKDMDTIEQGNCLLEHSLIPSDIK